MKHVLILLILVSVAAVLLLIGLGNNVYWDDEVDTAFLARTTMKSGFPVAWDGNNLYGFHNGQLLNRDLIVTVVPWLQYYVVAISFKLLGVSTIAGRLPFVVFGIATVVLLYLFARRYTHDERAAFFATLLLVLSPSFLLFSRQCRYYSLAMFAALLCLWAYTSLKGKGIREIAMFSCALVLLFYSNYITYFSFAGALLLASLFTLRSWPRWRSLLLSFLLSLICASPWLLYARPHETFPVPPLGPKLKSDIIIFYWYFREINANAFFPAIFVLLLPLILFRRRRDADARENGRRKLFVPDRANVFLVLVTLFSIVLIVLFTSQPREITGVANIRYAAHLIPLLCLIMGMVLATIWKKVKAVALALILVTIFTNLGSFQRFRPFLYEYLYEITHDYTTPYEAVIAFLDEKASEGDTVLVRPEYSTYPLMFYLGDRLRFSNILKESNTELVLNSPVKLPPYVYQGDIAPDWIVRFSHFPRDWLKGLDNKLWWGEMVPDSVLDHIRSSGIRYAGRRLNVFSRDGTRPELMHHYFIAPTSYPPSMDTYVFKKITE